LGLKRGDVVVLAPPGEFGKARPAVVIQSDFAITDSTVMFLPFTTDLGRYPMARVLVAPTDENGLRVPCEAMIDLIKTVSAAKVARLIGRLDRKSLEAIETALMVHLGLV
jgi:mRNA interferase MazF